MTDTFLKSNKAAALASLLALAPHTSNGWFPVFMHWLDVNGFLAAKSAK